MALYENNIRLKGFVGKDAEIHSTSTVNALAVFSLATKSSYKDKQSGEWVAHTDWHRIICFGKPAEFAKSLKKGDYAEIEGVLRSSEYEAESGNGTKTAKRRSWEIRASIVRKLDRSVSAEADATGEDDAA